MKKIILPALLLLTFAMAGFAQSQQLRISPFRFGGVHPMSSADGEPRGFFVINTESEGNWMFHFFDAELRETGKTLVEAPRFSFFNEAVIHNDKILVSFLVNAFRTSATYVLLDMEGNELARQTRTDMPMLNRGEQFFPRVFAHPETGFIITQTIRDGNTGYAVEHLNEELNTLWRKEFYAQRGTYHVYDLWAGSQDILIFEGNERRGNLLNARVVSLDPKTGNERFQKHLADGEHAFFPMATGFLDNGEAVLAGTYYRGDQIRGKNSKGLFFEKMDKDGKTTSMELYEWKGLRPLLRTSVTDWFFKVMPEVWIHGLEINKDGSFTAIAELYRYSGEVSQVDPETRKLKERYHRIRILDFMLFGFDEEGKMQYADRIERPHMVLKLDSEFTGPSGSLSERAGAGSLNRARAMKEKGALTYRFHQFSEDGSLQLGFMSYEAKSHYAYVMDLFEERNMVKFPLVKSKPKIITYAQMIDLCVNQSGFGFILTEMNTRSFDDSEVYWRGMFPAANGSMITYEYLPLNGQLSLNLVDMTEAE